MPQSTRLKFETPMINFYTGKEVLHPMPEELENLGIKAGDPQSKLEANRDELSKFTLATALDTMFDSIPIPTNTDFALYNQVLIDIRHAKQNSQDTIEMSKSDLEKFKKLFESKPPEKPQFNKIVGFIIECLEQTYVNIIAQPAPEIGSVNVE